MTDPIEATQADRELFIEIADKADHDEEILAGYHFTWEVEQLARYRIAAEERGARWGIEAGKRDHIDWYRLLKRIRKEHGSGMSDIAHGIVATFRALDPKTICDSARETDDAA